MCSARRSMVLRASSAAVAPVAEPIRLRFSRATPVLALTSSTLPGWLATSRVAQPWPRMRSERAPSMTSGARRL
ncbi:hypothetical protein D9M69_437620 [compost metagenome]